MKNIFLKPIVLMTLSLAVFTSCVKEDDYAIPTINTPLFKDGFESSWNSWTKFSVSGSQEWVLDTQYGNPDKCAKMSGYESVSNVNEDWLISPAIDLSAVESATLTFETASKFSGNLLEVKISTDYAGGDPNLATWTDISVILDTDTSYYIWTGSGNIDMSSFTGGNVYLAFKYTSTSSASTTWEVDNIIIIKN